MNCRRAEIVLVAMIADSMARAGHPSRVAVHVAGLPLDFKQRSGEFRLPNDA
jgi:hypothetical protein